MNKSKKPKNPKKTNKNLLSMDSLFQPSNKTLDFWLLQTIENKLTRDADKKRLAPIVEELSKLPIDKNQAQ